MGHPVLRAKRAAAREVRHQSAAVPELIDDMLDTMDDTTASASRRRRCTRACASSSRCSAGDDDEKTATPIRSINPEITPAARTRDGKAASASPTSAAWCRVHRHHAEGARPARRADRAALRRFSRPRRPARDRSSRRRALLRSHEVDRVADVSRRVSHASGARTETRSASFRPAPHASSPSRAPTAAARARPRVIDELHRAGDRVVTGHVGDQPVHQLADAPVRRMSLRRRAQLDDVHRLARVHLHLETDAIRHHDRVRRGVAEARGHADRAAPPSVHHLAPVVVRRRPHDRLRLGIAMERRQRLPLEREQAMTLQIAKRAVVGEDVETIATSARTRGPACAGGSRGRRRRRFPAPPGARPAVIRPRDREQVIVDRSRTSRTARRQRLSSRRRDRSPRASPRRADPRSPRRETARLRRESLRRVSASTRLQRPPRFG